MKNTATSLELWITLIDYSFSHCLISQGYACGDKIEEGRLMLQAALEPYGALGWHPALILPYPIPAELPVSLLAGRGTRRK